MIWPPPRDIESVAREISVSLDLVLRIAMFKLVHHSQGLVNYGKE